MKILLIIILICSTFFSFSQPGKVKINLTITDTIKPYFLGIYASKGKSFVQKITVVSSGSYFMKELDAGIYNFEFLSFESASRRLIIDSINIAKDSVTELAIIYPPPCKFIYPENYEPVCPYHHSDKIVKIAYGFPNKKMWRAAKKGLIHLGGCIRYHCDAKYYCTLHKIEI